MRKIHYPSDAFYEKIEKMTLTELETLIEKLYKDQDVNREKIEACLSKRRGLLNQAFEWTPENKGKLLRLNQRLIECWEKVDAEAKQTLKILNERINQPDDFLQDFNMEARVCSLIYKPDENGEFYEAEDCIEEVLNTFVNESYVVNIHTYFANDLDDHILYLDREQNWNTDRCFNGEFNAVFISQAIHDLYNHSCLSFHDVLKINRLRAELTVVHQHFVEI